MKKRLSKTNKERLTAIFALLSFTAYMPVSCMSAMATDIVAPNTLPVLNSAVNGYVDPTVTNNTMNVVVGQKVGDRVVGEKGTVAQFDWNSFNVGRDMTVNWAFSNNSQTALNRVLSTGGMSYIYGKLTNSSATGCPSCVNTSKVILINPAGVLFGNGSQVNLNSFTASTYDIKNAKDLSSLVEGSTEYNNYVSGGADVDSSLFNIAGYNKTVEFVANDNMVNGNGMLVTDGSGTRLASIVGEGTNIYGDKTVAMVGNKIDLHADSNGNASKLTTHFNETPNAFNNGQTRSAIKLVTGDGVHFQYTTAGDTTVNYTPVAATKTTGQQYGINLDKAELRTGDLVLYNGADKATEGVDASSGININDSKLYSMKLHGAATTDNHGNPMSANETGTFGRIEIVDKSKTTITSSDIQSMNAPVLDADGNPVLDDNGNMIPNTLDIVHGKIKIDGKRGVEIKDSKVMTAGSNDNTAANHITSGNINIVSSNGDINIIKTGNAESVIASRGNTTIRSTRGKVNVNGYDSIIANDPDVTFKDRTVTIEGKNADLTNTTLYAKNINVGATGTGNTDGITATGTNIVSDNTNLYAKNTKLDNSLVQYNNLSFYDSTNTSATKNNVTIANNTTLLDKDSAELTVTTNGNLTVDNSKLQKKGYGSTTVADQSAINLTSTTGNVTVQNSPNIVTPKVTLTASSGNVAVTNSNFTGNDTNTFTATGKNINIAGSNIKQYVPVELTAATDVNINGSKIESTTGNINITSTNKAGNISISNKSNVTTDNGNIALTGKKVTVKSNANGTDEADRSNVIAIGTGTNGIITIDQTGDMDLVNDYKFANVEAENKLTLKSEGNITGDGFNSGTIPLGVTPNVPTLSNVNTRFTLGSNGGEVDAGKDLTLTHTDNLNKVDLTGENINVSGDGPMTLTDVTAGSKPTGSTNFTSGDDVIVSGLTIKPNSGPTTITGDDITTPDGKVIDGNHNKVILNGTGDIDINVSNIDNPNKGLEINPNLNTGVHDGNRYSQEVLAGRDVTVNAGDEDLAVSKIKADTLDITAGKIVKGNTPITNEWDNLGIVKPNGSLEQVLPDSENSKGYIEVRTDGGFNVDTGTTYADNSGNIAYDGNYGTKTITERISDTEERFDTNHRTSSTTDTYFITDADGNPVTTTETIDNGVTTASSTVKENVGAPYKEYVYDDDGNVVGYYQHQDTKTTTTTTTTHSYTDNTYKLSETRQTTTDTYDVYQGQQKTTTVREQQHIATFDESGEPQGFVLIYGKTTTNTEPYEARLLEKDKVDRTSQVTQTGFVDSATRTTTGLVSSEDRYDRSSRTDVTPGRDTTWCQAEDNGGSNIPNMDSDLDLLGTEGLFAAVRNPRHAEGTSDDMPVDNGMTDTSGAAMNFAERLNFDEAGNSVSSFDNTNSSNADDDFYYGE